MERPLKDVRLIGPLAKELKPKDEPLDANEIRILIGRLADSVEGNASALQSVADGEMSEDAADMAIRMTRMNKGTLDSTASKLAAQHKELAGSFPNSWIKYQTESEKVDELLEEL